MPSQGKAASKTLKKVPEGRKLKASLDVEGAKYAGRTVRRRDYELFQSNDGDHDEHSDEPYEPVGTDDEEHEEAEEHDMESDSVTDAEDLSDGAEGDGAVDGDEDGRMAALREEYAALAAEEEAALLRRREGAASDVAKAAGVRAQRGLYERALELRILLQRVVAGANKMPRPSPRRELVASDAEVRAAYAELTQATEHTLSLLHSLVAAVGKQGGAIEPSADEPAEDGPEDDLEGATGSKGHKRRWEQIESLSSQWEDFRDESVDRWHRKTRLAVNIGKGELKALNQSVSSQVEQALRYGPRRHTLLRRSFLPRDSVKRLGEAEPQSSDKHPDGDGGPYEGAGSENGDPAVEGAEKYSDGELLDEETFDDGELYQILLKELLESGANVDSGHLPAGVQARGASKRSKKQVDRKASKGRKIRYTVQDKLVCFMAPEDIEVPIYAEQLFRSLFRGSR
mmetsp:Transcript_13295/g.48400  ORF Transcript_13295/g.48400 Transcript_13295/m.48400 type:complete len:456 (+) Transcript_13295:85-1452(+)